MNAIAPIGYLGTLNAAPRRESWGRLYHRISAGDRRNWSGKTNTLAHRVAHLMVSGADPRRILLMTFTRRAASQMAKRVERIACKVLGDGAGVLADALTWAGTFHGIGHASSAIAPTSSDSTPPLPSMTGRTRPTG